MIFFIFQMQIHPLAPEDSMALLRRSLASQCARKDVAYAEHHPTDGGDSTRGAGASSSSRRRRSSAHPPVMVDSSPGLFAAVTDWRRTY